MPASTDFHYYARQSHRRHHHRHHHHHHYDHFPPREFSDLSHKDIELLAPCLALMPDDASPSAYEKKINSMISTLPSHLKSKFPRILSGFCKMHREINFFVVCDISGVIERELQEILHSDIHGEIERMEKKKKCAGCALGVWGREVKVLMRIGAGIIAKLKPRDWKRSRRILFLEEWGRVCAGDGEEKGFFVEGMWEMGMMRFRLEKGKREHVERYVERALVAASTTSEKPVRPPRQPEQEDHVAFVVANEARQNFPEEGNPFEEGGEGEKRGEEERYDFPPMPAGRPAKVDFSQVSLVPPALQPVRQVRASSVYSQDEADEEFWGTARGLTESQFIDFIWMKRRRD